MLFSLQKKLGTLKMMEKIFLTIMVLGMNRITFFFNSPIFPIAAVFILLPLYNMPILIESDLNHLCL